MSEPQPPVGAPRLRSQSGAFDLPSILVGVVVVGILTAGVLAAIFGVIPWAQDNAAKQDLAAINTAQGVTYTKDGQAYKDLAGLEDADLISSLDQEKTEVTVSDEGQGFEAIVTAGNGNRWMISHKNNVPEQLSGPEAPGVPEGEIAWATGYCTPNVEKLVELEVSAPQHPGFFEYLKEAYGFEADMDAIEEWSRWIDANSGKVADLDMSSEEMAVAGELINSMYDRLDAVEIDGDLSWSQWEEQVFGSLRTTYKAYCVMYEGPIGFEYFPSRAPAEDNEWTPLVKSMTVSEGSTEPLVIGFPYAYDAEHFEVTTRSNYTFDSDVFELIEVDDAPYMTYTITPDEGGWPDHDGYVYFMVDSTGGDPYDVGHFEFRLNIYVK